MEDNQQLIGYQTQDCPCLEAAPDQERYPVFSYAQMRGDGVIDGLSIQQVLPSRYSGSTDLRQ